MREGRFYPDHGLERIVAYHERQDAPLRRGRRRAVAALRQADPHRHRARRRRPRQRRARAPSGPPVGSATPAATAPSPRSATSTRYADFRRRHGLGS